MARTVLRLQPTARRDDQQRTDGALLGALGIRTSKLQSAGTLARTDGIPLMPSSSEHAQYPVSTNSSDVGAFSPRCELAQYPVVVPMPVHVSTHSEQPRVSTQRQNRCCEWLLRAAFLVSSQPDTDTVGDDDAANLPPSAHAGSIPHWIPCRVGYRASWGPRLQCIPGKDTATAHFARKAHMRLG